MLEALLSSHFPFASSAASSPIRNLFALRARLQVIDLISLKPFDLETIGNSVKKTHRVLIVEECMRSGGIGASVRPSLHGPLLLAARPHPPPAALCRAQSGWRDEGIVRLRTCPRLIILLHPWKQTTKTNQLSATINENLMDELDCPVARLSSQDVPTPYAKTLENLTIVQSQQARASDRAGWGGTRKCGAVIEGGARRLSLVPAFPPFSCLTPSERSARRPRRWWTPSSQTCRWARARWWPPNGPGLHVEGGSSRDGLRCRVFALRARGRSHRCC